MEGGPVTPARPATHAGSDALGERGDDIWTLGFEGALKDIILWREPKVSGSLLCASLLVYVTDHGNLGLSAVLQLGCAGALLCFLFATFARAFRQHEAWLLDFPSELAPEFKAAARAAFELVMGAEVKPARGGEGVAFTDRRRGGAVPMLVRAARGSIADMVVATIGLLALAKVLRAVRPSSLLLGLSIALLTVFKIWELRREDVRKLVKTVRDLLDDVWEKFYDDLYWVRIKKRKDAQTREALREVDDRINQARRNAWRSR